MAKCENCDATLTEVCAYCLTNQLRASLKPLEDSLKPDHIADLLIFFGGAGSMAVIWALWWVSL